MNEMYIGQTVCGRFQIVRSLGRAGFYDNFVAVAKNHDKEYTLKLFDKNRNENVPPAVRERIFEEFTMLRSLNHPAIPRVLDIVEAADQIWIIMERVEGENLETVLARSGQIPEETVIDWAEQLCDVLGYLHSRIPPYIHRDICPQNVMLRCDGALMLVDFGIMMQYDPHNKYDSNVVFRRGYAAPEQFCGASEPRSDIYALGVTMHQMVTAMDPMKPPYELLPIRQLNSNVSEKLEQIIHRCIQRNPNDRFQSAEELMAALQGGPVYPNERKGLFGRLFGGRKSKS